MMLKFHSFVSVSKRVTCVELSADAVDKRFKFDFKLHRRYYVKESSTASDGLACAAVVV